MDVAAGQVLSPLLAVLLLLSFATCSSAGTNVTAGSTFSLPSYCPTSCGKINFRYPFGIGHGCFRPGFDLTCDASTNPPMLFLANGSEAIEVIDDIDPSSQLLAVNTPVAIMGRKLDTSSTTWTTQASRPYRVSIKNTLLVIGCNATASVVDPTSNVTISHCATTCPAAGGGPDLHGYINVSPQACKSSGVGYCCAQLTNDPKSYRINLSRSNRATNASSSVRALVVSSDHKFSLDATTVPVAYLRWNISDRLSCNEAKKNKNSYACLSNNGECSDEKSYVNGTYQSVGYSCKCLTNQGNPYIPEGCYDPSSTIGPTNGCAEKCGNVSIPFPFGLDKGCYKDTWFALTCDYTTDPPRLLFNLSDSFCGPISNIMVDEGQIELGSVNNSNFFTGSSKPFGFVQERAVFEWVIEYTTCELAEQNKSDLACLSANSKCENRFIKPEYNKERMGYFCKCSDGFQGNPYLLDGCRDIDECKNKELYGCYGDCVNTVGSYRCSSNKKQSIVLGAITGVSVGFGMLLLVVASIFATWKWKKINQRRIRRKHFNQNHGLLLQQLIASNEDATEKTKIFSLEDLEKATNNFDNLRILGQGGHGTVYKGILADQRVVAIKRSKITMKSEIDEFINEVTILSQINHRNVVKLFGCCLETEVPLLVYEFISNGTLFDHLHNHKLTLSWKDRLRIASEAAGALAYLHSSASTSIFHRDMKSSNILLDEYLIAKVSDFGASRLIPLDQTHVFTAIQGTFGYLDPEYYQTCELNGKSDVYSFGVILLELLTGEKTISPIQNDEERSLVMRFLQALKENRQFKLIEPRVMDEATEEDIDQVGKLVEMCLKLKGSERPTMKEVEMKLRFLSKDEPRKRHKEISEADRETTPLLSDIIGYDLPPSIVESLSQDTLDDSLEMKWMDSLGHPR